MHLLKITTFEIKTELDRILPIYNIIIKLDFVDVANVLPIGCHNLDKWHLARTIGSFRFYIRWFQSDCLSTLLAI